MAQLTVPSAGDPITVAFGQALTNRVNHTIPLYMSADVSKTGAWSGGSGASGITGLSFPVVNGKYYELNIRGCYTVGGTSTGLSIGYDQPGGSARFLLTLFSSAYDTSAYTEWLSAVDTCTGTSTTHTTAEHLWRFEGIYRASADGTFSLRYGRNGTSTTVTILAGSGGTVIES